uniref:Helitron helicase-like domain-containing protein n=1 Tax=Octopus bimaculoides TaxID=37653 RepID=A0A0L8HU10_OCTBM
MSDVSKYAKPDFFITYTCSPKFPEIVDNLQQNEIPENRPDLVARVYKSHLAELMRDIRDRHIFGVPVVHIHVIEFQKRGLPHCYMLVVLRNEDKLRNSVDIDRIVTAEIPDANDDPVLHDLKFPKNYRDETLLSLNGYPEYRRRNTGVTVQVGCHSVNNRNAVPYNAYLLKKYRAHINVEICSSVKSIKYIFKYVYKGHDCASVEVRDNPAADHAVTFQDLRTVGEILPTYKAAFLRHGLLSNDDTLEYTLLETDACRMPLQLRVMFCCPVHVYEPCKCSSLVNHSQRIHDENMALHSIDAILIENGINCLTIGLPEPLGVLQLDHHEDLDHPGIATFTDEQKLIANAVLESVDKR